MCFVPHRSPVLKNLAISRNGFRPRGFNIFIHAVSFLLPRNVAPFDPGRTVMVGFPATHYGSVCRFVHQLHRHPLLRSRPQNLRSRLVVRSEAAGVDRSEYRVDFPPPFIHVPYCLIISCSIRESWYTFSNATLWFCASPFLPKPCGKGWPYFSLPPSLFICPFVC